LTTARASCRSPAGVCPRSRTRPPTSRTRARPTSGTRGSTTGRGPSAVPRALQHPAALRAGEPPEELARCGTCVRASSLRFSVCKLLRMRRGAVSACEGPWAADGPPPWRCSSFEKSGPHDSCHVPIVRGTFSGAAFAAAPNVAGLGREFHIASYDLQLALNHLAHHIVFHWLP
jgi:hypothetical protein